jgi:DNA adenine methylase
VYKNIQSRHEELYHEIQQYIEDFYSCREEAVNRQPQNKEEATCNRENYYYWIRSIYNSLSSEEKNSPRGSAMFVFLNKTCFRGVFRMGPRGFNVPYGHYHHPEIINLNHLNEIHHLIQDVVFTCCDFETALSHVEEGDYAYLDPPYAPETKTSFVGYTENGFKIEDHHRLFSWIHQLTETGKKVMMSNADVPLVRDHFISEKYSIQSIVCKRAIHSKNPKSQTQEVMVKNYESMFPL